MLDLNTLTLEGLYRELDRRAPGLIRRLLDLARDEDLTIGTADPGAGGPWTGDVTAAACHDFITQSKTGVIAALNARSAGVAAGLAAIPALLDSFTNSLPGAGEIRWHPLIRDGDCIAPGQRLGTLTGPADAVVTLERTLLNLTARLSGVATLTARYVSAVRGYPARILDTRKTTPGLRLLEKYAVRCGGGALHRLGLADALLLKDNHLADIPDHRLADFTTLVIARAREAASKRGMSLTFCQLEADRPEQLRVILEAGGCGLDIVLLDNMAPPMLAECVALRNRLLPGLLLEASGGVNLQTVSAIAATGIDRISVGALTHQAVSLDLGLDRLAA